MKSHGLLNAELCHAIASLGHGDGLLVVDAGFPIPRDAWRVDLALARDAPDLRTVLDLIGDEMIVEGVQVAAELLTNNAPLAEWLGRRWPDLTLATVPHREVLETAPSRAKAIVRTGAFDPWGNVLLTSGVDVPKWFADPRIVVPEYYRERLGGGDDGPR